MREKGFLPSWGKRTHAHSGPPVSMIKKRINSFQHLMKIEGNSRPREFELAFKFL